MEFSVLYEIQRNLDEKIIVEHQLQGVNLTPSKVLALQVELGELANETRAFKYWSKNPPASRNVILEEYVDCLHFILSLGLDIGFTGTKIQDGVSGEQTLVEQIKTVFNQIHQFESTLGEAEYWILFEGFLVLGKKLGFESGQIYDAYLAKNKINHQRQAEGY
ncbi:dUTPase [Alkaliphilus metalliredigens QYMF]|uniref:dUTPase n=1 Tax=Alkaliphilus metalliredigens (strain QYMF) TaxID=293826 RepID=A6TX01_ALKMQ|nr:dUTP diphosphatase [Alkaliphilus metalliredigens]ABR50719.1 dUTPase [Alkaliphilus metalliredigens QYMF]